MISNPTTNAMRCRDMQLEAEGRLFGRSLLGCEPSSPFVERYCQVVREHPELSATEPSGAYLAAIVARQLDPVAIEFFMRLRGHQSLLQRRLTVALYLSEIGDESVRWQALGPGRLRAWLTLARIGVALPWRLCRGFLQAKSLDHV